jgi:hypothetical protein
MSQRVPKSERGRPKDGTLKAVVEYYWSSCLFRHYCSTRKITNIAFSGTLR